MLAGDLQWQPITTSSALSTPSLSSRERVASRQINESCLAEEVGLHEGAGQGLFVEDFKAANLQDLKLHPSLDPHWMLGGQLPVEAVHPGCVTLIRDFHPRLSGHSASLTASLDCLERERISLVHSARAPLYARQALGEHIRIISSPNLKSIQLHKSEAAQLRVHASGETR